MLDQVRIGDKYSFDDFGASMASREISQPPKKEIKETVPFSNQTYDFSKINGELYWDERELQFVFEIIADNPEDLEHKKSRFSNWIMNVFKEKIYDPFDPDFHYIGTFSDLEYADEDCVEKTTATATFLAYPYKVANKATNFVFAIPARNTKTVDVLNPSGHRIVPVVTADNAITITKDGASYVFAAGASSDSIFTLAMGESQLTIENAESTACNVQISFICEVF